MRTAALILCLVTIALAMNKDGHHDSSVLVLSEPVAKFYKYGHGRFYLTVFNFDKKHDLDEDGPRVFHYDYKNHKLGESSLSVRGYVKEGEALKKLVGKSVAFLEKKIDYIKEHIEDKHSEIVKYIVDKLFEKYGDQLPYLKEHIIAKLKEIVSEKVYEKLGPKIEHLVLGKLKLKYLIFREKVLEAKEGILGVDEEEMKAKMGHHKRDVGHAHDKKEEAIKEYIKEKVYYIVKAVLDKKLKIKIEKAKAIIAKLTDKKKYPVSAFTGFAGSVKFSCYDNGVHLFVEGNRPTRKELRELPKLGRISPSYVKVEGCEEH